LTIALLVLGGIVGIGLGRYFFGGWFNHLSLYSAIWSGSLALFEVRFVRYYSLAPETWLIIIASWLSFVIGSATYMVVRGQGIPQSGDRTGKIGPSERAVYVTIWILVGIALAVALQHWSVVLKKFGSLEFVLLFGNVVYSTRVHEGLPGMIPFLDSLGLTASLLAGIYTAMVGRVRVVSVLPLLVVIVQALAAMGRAKILLATLLFGSGFLLYRHRIRMNLRDSARASRARLFIGMVSVAVLVVLGAELIRSTRVTVEEFAGATKALKNLEGGSFITPSIYLYLTVQHGVFNRYLMSEKESVPIGTYSLAPFWRVLSKIGFETYVPQYQRFYSTPAPANTGTYLRELHADYGIWGVVVGPYLLGLLCSFTWCRAVETGRLLYFSVLGHLYSLVGVSFLLLATMWGYWVFSLLAGCVICFFLDRRESKRHTAPQVLPVTC